MHPHQKQKLRRSIIKVVAVIALIGFLFFSIGFWFNIIYFI